MFKVINEKLIFNFQIHETFYHIETFHKIGMCCECVAQFHPNNIRRLFQLFHQWKNHDCKIAFVFGFILLNLQLHIRNLIFRKDNFSNFLLYNIFYIHTISIELQIYGNKKTAPKSGLRNINIKLRICPRIIFYLEHHYLHHPIVLQ